MLFAFLGSASEWDGIFMNELFIVKEIKENVRQRKCTKLNNNLLLSIFTVIVNIGQQNTK